MPTKTKVTLEYDSSTGQLFDKSGPICIWAALQPLDDTASGKIGSAQLIELRDAGYETKDIVKLREAGFV